MSIGISLFDGYGGAWLALEKSGFSFGKMYASEVDPFCTDLVMKRFPEVEHLGDVTKWRDWDIQWEDVSLIIGGSPCQDVSFAGKKKGLVEGTRSSLLFSFIEILNHVRKVNPDVKFLLENTNMSRANLGVFNTVSGVEGTNIDAKDYSAVCRNRYYWFNWDVTLKKNDLTLKDVIGEGIVGCSRRARYVEGSSGKTYQKLEVRTDGKANCWTTVSKNSKFLDKGVERNATVEEGCILHEIPVDYFEGVPKTRALKMIGNGFHIGVVGQLLRGLK